MPTKMKLFVALSSLSILIELLAAQWAPLLISAALLAAALEMRYEARAELFVVVRLALMSAVVVWVIGVVDLASGRAVAGIQTIAGGLLALVPAVFYRWCFNQLDVVRWMLHRRRHHAW